MFFFGSFLIPLLSSRLPSRVLCKGSKEISRESMLRVNQAGEYGATRIYAGQLFVLGKTAAAPVIKEMAQQEEDHLKAFNHLMVQEEVRPTLLQPLWHVAGFALGAATAFLGEKAAHACTIAVEEVIDEHYQSQLEELDPESPLAHLIESCRQDEVHHKEIAESLGGREAPAYPVLEAAIKTISRVSIWLAQRA